MKKELCHSFYAYNVWKRIEMSGLFQTSLDKWPDVKILNNNPVLGHHSDQNVCNFPAIAPI